MTKNSKGEEVNVKTPKIRTKWTLGSTPKPSEETYWDNKTEAGVIIPSQKYLNIE